MSDARPKVLLTEHLDDEAADWLARRVDLVRQPHDDVAGLYRELADAAGLVVRTYTQVDGELLDHAPKLRVVGRAGVGLDNIDLDACRGRGVRVVYTPDANTQAVVEYVFALILDAVRPRLYMSEPPTADEFHDYRRQYLGLQLDTRTLGILGVGRIGRRVARVAAAIGMPVFCHDLLGPDELGLDAGFPGRFVDAGTLYAESDILTIHVDGRPENRGLIDASVLDRLRPHCLLLNAARGMLIDPGALAAWAARHADAGAAAILDVHDPEPPTADLPLWGRANVKLLPHLASRTPEAMANMSWVVRDVDAVLRGEQPQHPAV
jgi:phosphoglycerate dehydrogenase-like enzyme